MKTKKSVLITILVLLLTLAIAITAVFFVKEDTGKSQPQKENESVTEVSSKNESEEVNIEKVESEIVSSEEKFIEPDETKADEILKEHISKNSTKFCKPAFVLNSAA